MTETQITATITNPPDINVVIENPPDIAVSISAQGAKGDKGDTGADSTVPGPQGEQGIQGIQGETGADSTVPGPQGIQGIQGEHGDNAYCYIGYASDASGTGFTTTFNASLDYIAILTTDTVIASPAVGDFAGLWKNYKGAQGIQGIQGIQGVQGNAGVDGDDAFVYIAYASADDGTGFTTTFDAALNYIAIKSTTTAIASPIASDFTGLWKNYKGATGATGAQGIQGIPGTAEVPGGTTNNLVKINASDQLEDAGVSAASFATALGADDNYVTDAEKTKLANLSGTNTGDNTNFAPPLGADDNYVTDAEKAALHPQVVGGTPALTLGTANTAGTSPNFLRRDDTILAFDATAPTTQAFGDAAAVGAATVAARRDHKHAMMAAPTTVSGNAGSATVLATARAINGVNFDGSAAITIPDLILTAAPADHVATGIKIALTATATMNFGDVGYIASTGKVTFIDADAIASMSGVVMCVDSQIAADASGNFLLLGVARDDTWAWTVGGIIYGTVTATTGNTLSQTAPSGADDVIQILGVATHADRMLFSPQLVQVEHT